MNAPTAGLRQELTVADFSLTGAGMARRIGSVELFDKAKPPPASTPKGASDEAHKVSPPTAP